MVFLPSYETLYETASKASDLLEKEITAYRPAADNGKAGSLLEFGSLPVIVVPDIHARKEFLTNILKFSLPKDFTQTSRKFTVEQAMKQNKLLVICVGDGIHNELNKERWLKIQSEFEDLNFEGSAMKEEMSESLQTLQKLMELKIKYPENFHFLKGNHENILNENTGGDFAFLKFADEGLMVRTFISNYYGDDILYLISCYEKALPLLAYGSNYVVSHAEPVCPYTRDLLINARMYDIVVNGLIWTKNEDVPAGENTAEVMMEHLLKKDKIKEAVHFTGHRPVSGDYALRQKGKIIQLHNPRRQNIALVYADRIFDPETMIVSVEVKK
ncbi:MAG: metallophosphoesterase [Treponema sp.]|nr:metallophosphoesterase [Treponema sp.]